MTIYYIQSTLAVLLTFGLVIFLHEFGHFILCRKLGVRVERFAFGMGPEVWGFTKGETRYSICALPLGGFVKPAGEELEESSGKPDEYFGQSWNRRLMIVAAGPAMNYLLAFVLFSGVIYAKGMPESGQAPVIGNMMTGFPADRAGLKIDDQILSINGRPVSTWDELAGTIHKLPEQEVKLTYKRGTATSDLTVTPRLDAPSGHGVIGIYPKAVFKPVGLGAALVEGGAQCWQQTAFTVKTLLGKLVKRERPDLAGPVGIVNMVHRAAHSGWEDLVFLIGLISVAIGFFNILPIPLLDGGHGAMYLWEGLSGKKLTPNIVAKANGASIVFLVSLLLFATYGDLVRLRGERKARQEAPATAPSGAEVPPPESVRERPAPPEKIK